MNRYIKFPYFLIGFTFFTMSIFSNESDPQYLRFLYLEGQVHHGDSLVKEKVFIDGYLNHEAEIDEFSVSLVKKTDSKGRAFLDTSFRTVERIGQRSAYFQWISSETVAIERGHLGEMVLPESAARPVLRNVPRFPEYEVTPGDNWSLEGEEVHVIRMGEDFFGPYRGSVQVNYKYLENQNIDGILYARLSLDYNIYLPIREQGQPVKIISGTSSQILLWNIEEGRPQKKEEDFEFLMVMANGQTQEFIGRGITNYWLAEKLNRQESIKTLQMELAHIPGVQIESNERGLLLSLNETDKVLFDPESSELSNDQLYKMDQLSKSLEKFDDRDILISGHTANYGSHEGRVELSRKRAATVADFLFPLGRQGKGRLFLRGEGHVESFGSDQENRRVEILIFD